MFDVRRADVVKPVDLEKLSQSDLVLQNIVATAARTRKEVIVKVWWIEKKNLETIKKRVFNKLLLKCNNVHKFVLRVCLWKYPAKCEKI